MGSLNHDDLDVPGDKVTSPAVLAHVVLHTSAANFQPMIDFYTTFLGAQITHGNDFICFITYDSEHHRIALLSVPEAGPKQPQSSGLELIAFSYPTIHALLVAYRQRKYRGMLPVWSVNHGPTTSFYYKDPDGNQIEIQVDNFDRVEDATAFFSTPEFAKNPIGADVDPEDLIERLRKGESDAELKKREDVGARTDIPGIR